MSNSIIVYRNPLEQMFWESFITSPVIVPVFGALIMGVVSLIVIERIFTYIRNSNHYLRKTINVSIVTYASCFLAAIIGMVVFKILNI